MGPIVPSLLLTLSGVAHAGNPWPKVAPDPKAVTIDGVVEVPLVHCPGASDRVCVWGKAGERDVLVQILPESGMSWVAPPTAKQLALEVKKKSVGAPIGDVELATLESLSIGALTIEGATVGSKSPDNNPHSVYDELRDEVREGVGYDIGLGLSGFGEDLAWAILPSKGVVRFAPAAAGADLVSQLGGTPTAIEAAPARKVQHKRDKVWQSPDFLLLPVKFGESEVKAKLAWGWWSSSVDARVALPETAARVKVGDATSVHIPVTLPGTKAESTWVRPVSDYILEAHFEGVSSTHYGIVGRDVLAEFDVAMSPATGQIAFKYAEAQTRTDPLPKLLERAQADLADAVKKEEEAAADAKDDEASKADADKPKGGASAWKAIAEIREAMGDIKGATEALANVAAINDTSCDAWMDLGDRYRTAGDLAAAETAYTKAKDLYVAWWSDDIPLAKKWADLDAREVALHTKPHLAALTRAEYTELIAKAGKKGKEPVELGVPEGVEPQAGQCVGVFANLAGVYLAQGSFDKLDALAKQAAPYDDVTPLIVGNAALGQGRFEQSHGPYRKAMRLDLNANLYARNGLALALAAQGAYDQAAPLFDLYFADGLAVSDAAAWVPVAGAGTSPEAAQARARELAHQHVTSKGANYAWALAAHANGDLGARKTAIGRLNLVVEDTLRFDPTNAYALAARGLGAVLAGDLDKAKADLAAARASKDAPWIEETWLLEAAIADAEGRPDDAKAARRQAGVRHPFDPLFARYAIEGLDGAGAAD